MFAATGTRFRASEVLLVAVEGELVLLFDPSSELIDVSSTKATLRFLAGLARFIFAGSQNYVCQL
jgi:hypothetical protein